MNPTWKTKLKEAWNENPMAVIAVAATALTAVAKTVDSVSGARSKKAYTKMINRRYR